MRNALASMLGQRLPAPVEGAIEKLLALDRFARLYEDAPGARSLAERSLALLNVSPRISARDLALIPRQGAVVAVANHPFGLIEGAILAALLSAVRPDVKILANHLLSSVPDAAQSCIFVDPSGGEQSGPRQSPGAEGSRRVVEARRPAVCVPGRRSVALESERARDRRSGMEPQRGAPDPHHGRNGFADLLSRRQQRAFSVARFPAPARAHGAAAPRVFQQAQPQHRTSRRQPDRAGQDPSVPGRCLADSLSAAPDLSAAESRSSQAIACRCRSACRIQCPR